MKKLVFSLIALITLSTGCSNDASPEDVAKVTYEWEKATLKADYKREQELLYKEGTYEIHKNTPERDNSLKYEDMKIEVYYDEKNEWYYSLFSYTNPEKGNKVEDIYVVRDKNKDLKIDIEESKDIDRVNIKNSFKQEACIHCD